MANHSDTRKSNKGSSSTSRSGDSSRMKGGQRIKESMSGAGPSGARPDEGRPQKSSGGQHSHAGNTGFSSGQISPQAGSTGRTTTPKRTGGAPRDDRDQ